MPHPDRPVHSIGFTCSILFGFLLIAVPLVPFNFLNASRLSPLGLFLANALRFFPFWVALLLAVLGFLYARRARWDPALLPFAALLFGYLLAALLGALSSVTLNQSVARSVFYFATGDLLCLAGGLVIRKRAVIQRLLVLSMVTAVFVSVYGLADMFLGLHWLRREVFTEENPLMGQFVGNVTTSRAHRDHRESTASGDLFDVYEPLFSLYCFQRSGKGGSIGRGVRVHPGRDTAVFHV